MTPFTTNLKRLRKARNMTQDDLAGMLHVTRQTVSSWETGRCQPDIETLTALAEALGADINELIYGVKPGEYPKFQRKYVIWCAVCGGVAAVIVLYTLLIEPYVKRYCNTFYIAWPLILGYYILPVIGSFTGGMFLPALLSLFSPVRPGERWRRRCLWLGLLVGVPSLMALFGIFGGNRWYGLLLYPAGRGMLSCILPFLSGLLIFLGTNKA